MSAFASASLHRRSALGCVIVLVVLSCMAMASSAQPFVICDFGFDGGAGATVHLVSATSHQPLPGIRVRLMDGLERVHARTTDSTGTAEFNVPLSYELESTWPKPWRIWTTDSLGYESFEIRFRASPGEIMELELPLQRRPRGVRRTASGRPR